MMWITTGAATHTRMNITRRLRPSFRTYSNMRTMIKFWLHSITLCLSLTVLLMARHVSGAAGSFMGESIGLVIILLSCQVCFHLNGVDELLVDSKLQMLLRKALKSVGAGLLAAALL